MEKGDIRPACLADAGSCYQPSLHLIYVVSYNPTPSFPPLPPARTPLLHPQTHFHSDDCLVAPHRRVGATFRLKVPNQADVRQEDCAAALFPVVVRVSEAGGGFTLSALLALNVFDLSFWDFTAAD